MTSGHERHDSGQDQVSNPPGLTQLAYRAGDFATFRRALLSPLPGEQELVNWLPNAGDLGLQALDWWAYLADILTFYNERIANGSYLGPAVAQPGPQNAAGLAALLGYLTTPAITATGFVAAIRGASGQGGPLVIPAGLQIASTPTAAAPAAQLFEVTSDRTFTGPSDVVIGLPADPALFGPVGGGPATGQRVTGQSAPSQPGAGQPAVGQHGTGDAEQRTVLLNGLVAVTSGDQFVHLSQGWEGTTADWAVVTAQSAAAEQDPAGRRNTRVTLSSTDWHGLAPAQAASPPASAVPAPATAAAAALAAGYRLQRAPLTASLLTMAASTGGPLGTGGNAPAGPAPQTLTVPLATLVRNLNPGDNVLFTGTTGGAAPRAIQLLAQVTGYAEQVTQVPAAGLTTTKSPAPNAYISHTNLTLRTAGAESDVAALRSALGTPALSGVVLRYGFRDVGTPVLTPATALTQLPVTVTIPVDMRLPDDGPVALQDANGTGLLVSAVADAVPGTATIALTDGRPARLSPALIAPIQLLADLVPVSRGTTVTAETLGDGNPAAAGQTFPLQHSPLVYLPPSEAGDAPVSTLSVSVNGFPWREVRTFSGQPPHATVYMVSQLPDGSVQVQFGDGVNGARLPSGTGNVTATYRYGPPAPPPPARALATVLQPQPNLGSARNPVDIIPGTGLETAGETAAAAPATVVLLPGATSASPPLISLADSERLAVTVAGVTRARAYWTWDAELRCPAVTVYVGSDTDAAAAVTAVTAVSGLYLRGASRVPLRAAPARSLGLTVGCQLVGAPGASETAVRTAATEALIGSDGLFSPPGLGIGQRLYHSQIEGALTGGGLATVLSLSVRRQAGGDPDEPALDPGQDGYFSLAAADLTISVVTR
jgi:hypothetical protein